MIARGFFLGLLAFGLAPDFAQAQPREKPARIGYLDLATRQSLLDSGRHGALLDGLRQQGFVEGKNLVLEARYADGHADRLDALAAELVRMKVDVILTAGSQASHAAQRTTTKVPIVVVATTDPVREGIAVSLARPGGNITGMTTGTSDTVEKLVEFLNVAAPGLKRIAVVTSQVSSSHPPLLLRIQSTAAKIGKEVVPLSVRTPEDIERGFAAMPGDRIEGVIVLADAFLFQQRTRIAGLALKQRLPSIYATLGYAEAGGLMNYGADVADNFRNAAVFVNKILKGAKPGELPFEQPMRYYLQVNRKTAGTLGIKQSQELLRAADKVFE